MDYDPTCPIIKSMVVLDPDGKRVAVKYYSPEYASVVQQSSYEKSLFAKTCRTNARAEAEIITFDDITSVYSSVGDLMFYVTGSSEENELILYSVLQAFTESVSLLLRGSVDKRTVLQNLDLVLLTVDEIIDGGLILETDPTVITSRVTMKGAESEVPITEQSFTQAMQNVREQLARSLLK